MALIKCAECGNDVSDKASSCPNCGCPMEEIIKSHNNTKQAEERKSNDTSKATVSPNSTEKAVTPRSLKKIVGIGTAIGLIVVVGCICAWYFGLKVPRDDAYKSYLSEVQAVNDEIQLYNDAINNYNKKAEEIKESNDSFDKTISTAQGLIDSGDMPYEAGKMTLLNNSVKEARNNKVPLPELKSLVEPVQIDTDIKNKKKSLIESEKDKLSDERSKYSDDISKITSETDSLTVPDYTSYVSKIETLSRDLENSYAIQRQITAPSEEWVITRLGRVSDVANMAPVTEDHDPNGNLNKAGGYTSTVYFGTPLLGTEELSGDTLIDKGTMAGGAIETYKTVEEAERRNEYLASFDGMGYLASGSHIVLGTMVIRTSDDLKASQQESLTNSIIAAMISMD